MPALYDLERKPDKGCEIQTTCCAQLGIMCRLKLVKTATANQEDRRSNGHAGSLNAGTCDLLDLVYPWANTDRVVVADSHFALVQAARELYKVGLRFIGVVKTSTKSYPMEYLSGIQLEGEDPIRGVRGAQLALHHRSDDHNPDLLAFVWCDKNRRYFISTCSNMRPAEPIYRERWRQVASVETNLPPIKVGMEIPQPNCSKLYYDGCSKIDHHNRKTNQHAVR